LWMRWWTFGYWRHGVSQLANTLYISGHSEYSVRITEALPTQRQNVTLKCELFPQFYLPNWKLEWLGHIW
jgi:hypothetical protein